MMPYDRQGSAGRAGRGRRVSASRRERGLTLLEVIAVMTIMGIIAAIGVTYASSWIRREQMRSSAYVIQTHMQMARVEAMSRNRDCRFVIDDSDGSIRVIDLNDPSDTTDDILIASAELPTAINFQRPDVGSPITLNNVSGTLWETTFRQDGVVSSGSGSVHIATDDLYRKVSVYVAGGVHLQTWDGSTWIEGA